jgi:hypothetical protein
MRGSNFQQAIKLVVIVVALAVTSPGWGKLSEDLERQLEAAKYVYISSARKDGTLSEKAEIWFLYHGGAVYVGTRPASWRVKRIKWGRPRAKIWVGSRDGPSFDAVGAVVDEPNVYPVLFERFAKKYPEGWPKFERSFREGFKDGSRVLVKYTPVGE